MFWDLRRCHTDTQLSGAKGTYLLWPMNTLPLLWKSSSLSARWPGVKVSSERPQPLHWSLLSHGPRPNIENSQGLGCPKWLKGRVFSRLWLGCFHPDHLITNYVFWGTWLNLFKPRFQCLENVVNSSYLAGCLLVPRPGKSGCSYDDIRDWYNCREAQVTQLRGSSKAVFRPQQREICKQCPRYSRVMVPGEFTLMAPKILRELRYHQGTQAC